MFNPIRFLKNLFVDFLLLVSGTYVGSPNISETEKQSLKEESSTASD